MGGGGSLLFTFKSKLIFHNSLHSLTRLSTTPPGCYPKEPIGQFITCLENSGQEGPFWVCAFSIFQNQGDDDKPTITDQLGPDPEFGPFATVLKQADVMIAVVTTLCDIYTQL